MTTATLDLAPIPYTTNGVQITLSQAGPNAYRVEVAQVSAGFVITECQGLTRSYPTEAHARLVARQYAILFKAGWTITQVTALTRNASLLPADAIAAGIQQEMGGGHGQARNLTRLRRLTAARDLLTPADELAAQRALADRIGADLAARWAA